jgi:hypothetical protein
MKNFALVVGLMVVMQLIWQVLTLFCLAIWLGTFVILYFFHDTGKPKRRRLFFRCRHGHGIHRSGLSCFHGSAED